MRLAAILVAVWLVSILVGTPGEGELLLCDVGGPCGAFYAKLGLDMAGTLSGMFAVVLVAVAGARWLRARRSHE